MPITNPDITAIVATIGIEPFSQRTHDETELNNKLLASPTLLSLVKLFLTKQGLPERTLRSAIQKSIVTAYCNEQYLKSWRKRVNPSFDQSASLMDDDEIALPPFEEHLAKLEAIKSQPPAGVTANPMTETWLKDLFLQVEKAAKAIVKSELAATSLQLTDDVKNQIRTIVKLQSAATSAEIAEAVATRIVNELMPPREIFIRTSSSATSGINIGLQHEKFPTLLRAIEAKDHKGFRLNVWLTGPTASGKTTAAENVAKALNLPFGSDGSLDADYKVLGFRDANGNIISTQFLSIYEGGGIYLADEIDNWHPSALLALNAALANGWVSSPKGMIKRHKDCAIIAAANTWGLGATNEYVGRTKLDAASLDRFQPKIHWPVDTSLERAVAFNQAGIIGHAWHSIVESLRAAAKQQGLKIIISPRGTFAGISLLLSGFPADEVLAMTLTAGLSPEQVKGITYTSYNIPKQLQDLDLLILNSNKTKEEPIIEAEISSALTTSEISDEELLDELANEEQLEQEIINEINFQKESRTLAEIFGDNRSNVF